MVDEYTPTTDEVREFHWEAVIAAIPSMPDPNAQFDRWYAGERAKAKAEALREAADHLATPYITWTNGGTTSVYSSVAEAETGLSKAVELTAWLRAEATRIEKEAGQ